MKVNIKVLILLLYFILKFLKNNQRIRTPSIAIDCRLVISDRKYENIDYWELGLIPRRKNIERIVLFLICLIWIGEWKTKGKYKKSRS